MQVRRGCGGSKIKAITWVGQMHGGYVVCRKLINSGELNFLTINNVYSRVATLYSTVGNLEMFGRLRFFC